MSSIRYSLIAATLLFVLSSLSCSNKVEQFVTLFDGQSFAGWEGDLEFFRIADGAIVAGTLEKDIPLNQFLCTTSEYDNFELRLKVRIVGEETNAGIQVRSRRVPDNHEMVGYQADVGEGWWGKLYDESRRNKVLAEPEAGAVDKVLKPDDWNEYTIRCEGKRVQLWINGLKTVDYVETDETLEQNGLIGLQIHSGQPAEAWYKDIRIRAL